MTVAAEKPCCPAFVGAVVELVICLADTDLSLLGCFEGSSQIYDPVTVNPPRW